jgi:formylmethanofuran dehydrogenase subunit E
MKDYSYFLKKVNDFHGHTCLGIAFGTLMALAAMQYLGLDPHQKNKDVLAYAEIDRCMTDAVMVITGCSLGRRSLKHVDYGKFAMTLVNQHSGHAVRVTTTESFNNAANVDEALRTIASRPLEELIYLQDVHIHIPETDLPGHPLKKAVCTVCKELIMDGRDVIHNDVIMCRGCAQGHYYTEIKE